MDNNEVKFIRKNIKNSTESKRITNILKLLFMLLKQDNQGVEYYAKELGCKVPTIKKYLKDIRASYNANDNSGFDVVFDTRDKHYELFSYIKFPAFTPEAIEALHMAVRYLVRHEGTPFEHLTEIEQQLQRYFTKEIREKLNKPIEVAGPEIKSKLEEVLNIIDEAINRKMKLIINYAPTFQKESINIKREIIPSTLQIYDYEWYIKGFCLKDNIFKTFAVNQIISMKCEKLTKAEEKLMTVNPDLTPAHSWDWSYDNVVHSLKTVKIKFSGAMGEKMKKKSRFRKEHPSQQIEFNGNETIISFNVRNPYNMIPWILQFGNQAQVIEPEVLRSKIKSHLDSIRELY